MAQGGRQLAIAHRLSFPSGSRPRYGTHFLGKARHPLGPLLNEASDACIYPRHSLGYLWWLRD
jgi:hypothetical protein